MQIEQPNAAPSRTLDLLTVAEAAERERLGEAVLRRDIARGELRALRSCGGDWLIQEDEIWLWLVPPVRWPVQEATWREVLCGDPCAYCGEPMEHIDHIEPRSAGGLNVWTNLTAACAACNVSKFNRSLLTHLLRRQTTTPNAPMSVAAEKDPVLTVEQVAAQLQVSEAVVRAWARRGQIPVIRLPGARLWRFRQSSLDAWLSEQERGAR